MVCAEIQRRGEDVGFKVGCLSNRRTRGHRAGTFPYTGQFRARVTEVSHRRIASRTILRKWEADGKPGCGVRELGEPVHREQRAQWTDEGNIQARVATSREQGAGWRSCPAILIDCSRCERTVKRFPDLGRTPSSKRAESGVKKGPCRYVHDTAESGFGMR